MFSFISSKSVKVFNNLKKQPPKSLKTFERIQKLIKIHFSKTFTYNIIVIYSNEFMQFYMNVILPLWMRNELFCNKIILVHIHKKWPWIKSMIWMALNFYLIHLIVQTWHLPIIIYFFKGRQFKDVKFRVQVFIDSKPKEWFRQGLNELTKRWIQTIDHDGLYFKYWFYIVLTCYKYMFLI